MPTGHKTYTQAHTEVNSNPINPYRNVWIIKIISEMLSSDLAVTEVGILNMPACLVVMDFVYHNA